MSFDAPASVVSMKGLTRVYGADIRALDDIDLEIRRTEFMAIVGPSGSGKTTLLNVAGTLDRPSTGQVVELFGDTVAGRQITRPVLKFCQHAKTEAKHGHGDRGDRSH